MGLLADIFATRKTLEDLQNRLKSETSDYQAKIALLKTDIEDLQKQKEELSNANIIGQEEFIQFINRIIDGIEKDIKNDNYTEFFNVVRDYIKTFANKIYLDEIENIYAYVYGLLIYHCYKFTEENKKATDPDTITQNISAWNLAHLIDEQGNQKGYKKYQERKEQNEFFIDGVLRDKNIEVYTEQPAKLIAYCDDMGTRYMQEKERQDKNLDALQKEYEQERSKLEDAIAETKQEKAKYLQETEKYRKEIEFMHSVNSSPSNKQAKTMPDVPLPQPATPRIVKKYSAYTDLLKDFYKTSDNKIAQAYSFKQEEKCLICGNSTVGQDRKVLSCGLFVHTKCYDESKAVVSQITSHQDYLDNYSKKQKIKKLILVNNFWPDYPEDWQQRKAIVIREARGQCEECGGKNMKLDVHHDQPLTAGGTNDLDNLICLCEECHQKRHPGFQLNKQFRRSRNRELINKAIQTGKYINFIYRNKQGLLTQRTIKPIRYVETQQGASAISSICFLRKQEREFVIHKMKYVKLVDEVVKSECKEIYEEYPNLFL